MDNLDDIRWRAVQLRDVSATDIFVNGVSSTGVY
ncbi:MAG TPA: Ada metal-binding domain-containing protein [Acidimicrobiales bacterium]